MVKLPSKICTILSVLNDYLGKGILTDSTNSTKVCLAATTKVMGQTFRPDSVLNNLFKANESVV